MRLFRAIYSTESIKNINYDFDAQNLTAAIEYSKWKFSAKDIRIVELDPCTLREINLTFIDKLQTVLLVGLKTNVETESINLENKLKADPKSITSSELRKLFYYAGIKSVQIGNTTINI